MKLWIMKLIEKGKTCNSECDFKFNCNEHGSSWVLRNVLTADLYILYRQCGASEEKTIIYKPTEQLKKNRF